MTRKQRPRRSARRNPLSGAVTSDNRDRARLSLGEVLYAEMVWLLGDPMGVVSPFEDDDTDEDGWPTI